MSEEINGNLKSERLKKTYRHRRLGDVEKETKEIKKEECKETLSVEEIAKYKKEIYDEIIKIENVFYGRYESFEKYLVNDKSRKKFIAELVNGCDVEGGEEKKANYRKMFEIFFDLIIAYIDSQCRKSDLIFYSFKKMAECTENAQGEKFSECIMGIMMSALNENDEDEETRRVYTLSKKFEKMYNNVDGGFDYTFFHNRIVRSIDSFLLKRGIPSFATQEKREATKSELYILHTYAHDFMRKLQLDVEED